MISDIPVEILVTVGAGIVLLFVVCIVALLVRRKCQQADLNNQAIYNQSTVSSSGGYATTKPHTRSSWTCTYKAGHQHQVDTHIWETPLPEPSVDEYTLPMNMRQPHSATQSHAMLDSMEYTVPVSTVNTLDGTSLKPEYTKPVKVSIKGESVAENPLLGLHSSDQSQANYYYYDPSSGEQSEYMAPTQSEVKDATDMSRTQHRSPGDHHGITADISPITMPVQQTRECDYRTLIRLDDPST